MDEYLKPIDRDNCAGHKRPVLNQQVIVYTWDEERNGKTNPAHWSVAKIGIIREERR